MSDPGPATSFPAHWLAAADGPPIREAARVALLDPGDQVLLMRYDGPPNGTHWSTPGGGLEPGESHRDAALRELAEETGWADIVLGPEIRRHEHRLWGADGHYYLQRERIYLARTQLPGRQITGVTAMHRSDGISAWRWWPLPELSATAEVVWPAGLGATIESALGR